MLKPLTDVLARLLMPVHEPKPKAPTKAPTKPKARKAKPKETDAEPPQTT